MKRLPALTALIALLLAPAAARAGLVPNYLQTYGPGEIVFAREVEVGPDGTIYVINRWSSKIELYTKRGTHVGGWGSHGSGPGQFEEPFGLAVAPWNDVYVSDATLNRVQRFNQAGVLLGSWGTGGSGPGQFNSPYAIAMGKDGTLYVADSFNHRVQRFDAVGTYLGEWGGEGSGPGQLNLPHGIAVDAAGNVYVADSYNHRIQKFTSTGTWLAQWGSHGTGNGQFEFPYGLAIDAGGNLYVNDTNNSRVQRFTTTGAFVSKWGSQGNGIGQFQGLQGIAVSADGRIHVSDTNSRVQVFTTAEFTGHETIGAWGSEGDGNGEFDFPFGIAVAPDGFVYVVDYILNRVQKFTYFGAWAGAWGSTGNGPGQFQTPHGIAVDAAGVIYVTDNGNARVQKFDASGAYLGEWGTAGTGPGQLNSAGDIAIDGLGYVYIADANRVQRFTSNGVYLNGWAAQGAYGIGIDLENFVYVACPGYHLVRKYHPSTGALITEWGSYGTGPGQFDNVSDVAADSTGDIYVCDYTRIQRFTSRGAYLQEWGEVGPALRQLGAPQRIAADATGNLYVTEATNHRVQKFGSPPVILRVEDVPNDQGGAVKIRFRRTSAETEAPGMFTQYDVYRNDGLIWTHVGSVPVDGSTDSVIVATNGTASPVANGMAEFSVRAVLAFPGAHVPNGTLHGYSVDNLAPPTPSPFTAAYSSGTTWLHWQPGGAVPDLAQYRLYRDVSPSFEPGPGNQIAAVSDTFFNDVGPAGGYYRIVAVDQNGNVSPSALVGPGQTVSAPSGGPAFGFEPIRSPVLARDLALGGSLPTADPARVELFDISGRRVWSRELRAAGRFQLTPARERLLAPGVYAARVSQAGRSSRARVVVLD